jgi:glutathione S-transferase
MQKVELSTLSKSHCHLLRKPLECFATHWLEISMARVLYTSWFSTFARKVALGLELKGLAYQSVDALRREFREQLKQLNSRIEVPALVDDGLVIVNSSDILQYLDWRYPTTLLYPDSIADKVTARALERLADHRLDPIVVDCSLWHWTDRSDQAPEGLLQAGQQDLDSAFAVLESELAKRPTPWPFATPGIVECAWFPNLAAVIPLGFKIDATRFPSVLGWLSAMRDHPVFKNDRQRTAAFLKSLSTSDHELKRIFWSGERMEWLFSRGFHSWFANEVATDRVAFPG